jgi:transposase
MSANLFGKRQKQNKSKKTKGKQNNKTKRNTSKKGGNVKKQKLTDDEIKQILEPFQEKPGITTKQLEIAKDKLKNLKFENPEDFLSLWGEKPKTLYLQGNVRAQEWFKDGSEDPAMWPTSEDY